MGRVASETISGAKWMILQKCASQPVQFLCGIVLARFISPEEFGILGLTALFFALASTLAEAGFGSALIRDIHRTEEDINTVFWTNIAFSAIACAALFLAAPWFVQFFNQPALLWLTRISAMNMFIGSLSSVHWTLYTCRRDFKTPALIATPIGLLSMGVAMLGAWWGLGFWAIVVQSVFATIINLIVIWIVSPWKPRFVWSGASFRKFFSYGIKLVGSGIINQAFTHIKSLLIGKFYAPAQLGLFSRAWHMASMPSGTINGMLQSVTFPILATLQEDENRLLQVYSMYIRITSLGIFFISWLLIALAKPTILLLYGEAWAPCIPYLQVVTLGIMCYHFGTININLLLVKGRSDITLRIDFIKKIISVGLIIPALYISMMAVCWSSVIFVPIGLFINSYYTSRLYGFTLRRQLRDFLPYFCLSVICVLPAWLITLTSLPNLIQLLFGSCTAGILYIGILHMANDEAFQAILKALKNSKYGQKLYSKKQKHRDNS